MVFRDKESMERAREAMNKARQSPRTQAAIQRISNGDDASELIFDLGRIILAPYADDSVIDSISTRLNAIKLEFVPVDEIEKLNLALDGFAAYVAENDLSHEKKDVLDRLKVSEKGISKIIDR